MVRITKICLLRTDPGIVGMHLVKRASTIAFTIVLRNKHRYRTSIGRYEIDKPCVTREERVFKNLRKAYQFRGYLRRLENSSTRKLLCTNIIVSNAVGTS